MEHKFRKLTPTDTAKLDSYKKALDFVFENNDLCNIAITGPYSSGKSSIVKTYESKYPDKKLMHISLARFTSNGYEIEKDEQLDNKEIRVENEYSTIEGKILNQLIHQISADEIPQTKFKVKRKISKKRIVWESILFVVGIIALLYLILFDYWQDYIYLILVNGRLFNILKYTLLPEVLFFAGTTVSIILGYIVYKLIEIQKIKNIFKKVNIQGNEIEILEDSKESYFDKYLNEVLYLFENCDKDAIIFEDIDRFDTIRIFERLREINTLVNFRIQDNKKTLKFIYLLRDDLFISKERTKFFDFIIPVVPVVDSSNSYNKLLEYFGETNILPKFDQHFLQGLSLYIDDMRILRNICNEFTIYFKNLNSIELDPNRMLAIITYKNLFPKDFSDLQLNKGFVYSLFTCKELFVKDVIVRIEQEIEINNDKLKLINKELLETVDELNILFKAKHYRNYSFNSDEIFDHLDNSQKKEYLSRKEPLENSKKISERKINEKIAELKKKIVCIKGKKIAEIIRENSDIDLFEFVINNKLINDKTLCYITKSDYFDLLRFLINNGYFDETYFDYISHFYDDSLTINDKKYVRGVLEKNPKEYSYQLYDPRKVCSYLKITDFSSKETLNFTLLDYLLNSKEDKDLLEALIIQISNTKNLTFIQEFFDRNENLVAFVVAINEYSPSTFSFLITDDIINERTRYIYSLYTLAYSSEDTVLKVFSDINTREYISEHDSYLLFRNDSNFNVDYVKFVSRLKLIDIKFKKFSNYNAQLLELVYSESLYELNFENIKLFLNTFYNISNEDNIIKRNYTLISSNTETPLFNYVQNNISEYIKVILSKFDGVITDDIVSCTSILNNTNIDNDYKLEYLDRLETLIIDIVSIKDNSLWGRLLDKNKISNNEINIIEYFISRNSLDQSLVNFINNSFNKLNFEILNKSIYTDEVREKFFNAVVDCDQINDNKYFEILSTLEFIIISLDFNDLSDNKINILIESDLIEMNELNLEFIREHYPNHKIKYIIKNINKYLKIIDDSLYDYEEMINVLSADISDSDKLAILQLVDEKLTIRGKNYSAPVINHILSNNFDTSELPYILRNYESFDDITKETILSIACSYINTVIDNAEIISINLRKRLLYSEEITENKRFDLFITSLPYLNRDEIVNLLSFMNLSKFNKIFEQNTRPSFEINETNANLLDAFVSNKLISGYHMNRDKTRYNIRR